MSKNCWEVLDCNRPDCPAHTESKYDGVNGGKNAGRFCWAVSGTFCHGEVQGEFAHKKLTCMTCPVFKEVKSEEGPSFQLMV